MAYLRAQATQLALQQSTSNEKIKRPLQSRRRLQKRNAELKLVLTTLSRQNILLNETAEHSPQRAGHCTEQPWCIQPAATQDKCLIHACHMLEHYENGMKLWAAIPLFHLRVLLLLK